jgi:hypothetical protein
VPTSRVQFEFTLRSFGWADGRIAIGNAAAAPTASYLSDALGDLLRAVCTLCEGADEARAAWQEEPGEYRWIFGRTGQCVRLVLLELPDWGLPDSQGRPVLDAECELDALARAVIGAAAAIKEDIGIDGYLERWIYYPFPANDLEALERWVGA